MLVFKRKFEGKNSKSERPLSKQISRSTYFHELGQNINHGILEQNKFEDNIY